MAVPSGHGVGWPAYGESQKQLVRLKRERLRSSSNGRARITGVPQNLHVIQ